MTAAPAAPAADRLEVLDALRGFALLGILLANIQYWSGWVMMAPPRRAELAGQPLAGAFDAAMHFLVDGKFYTLFSLLFGAGFALQLARLERVGHDGLALYRRRVLGLLGIGLVHFLLVWDGDILTLYALLGLLLPLFARWSPRALLLAAFLLVFVVPPAGRALFAALGWAPEQALFDLGARVAVALGADPAPEATIAWMQREDPAALGAWLASGPFYSLGFRLESWRIPKVLGIMLLGLWCGRGLASGELLADRRRLKQVLFAGLAIGLPASAWYALTPGAGQAHWSSMVGTVPLALAYGSAFVLAWPHARRWLGVFTWPGRMALSNYLLQSVLGVVVFYGVGLGWVGHLAPPAFMAYAFALYAAQALASRAWLARHAQGPAEAAWRRWTYRGAGARPAA